MAITIKCRMQYGSVARNTNRMRLSNIVGADAPMPLRDHVASARRSSRAVRRPLEDAQRVPTIVARRDEPTSIGPAGQLNSGTVKSKPREDGTFSGSRALRKRP